MSWLASLAAFVPVLGEFFQWLLSPERLQRNRLAKEKAAREQFVEQLTEMVAEEKEDKINEAVEDILRRADNLGMLD